MSEQFERLEFLLNAYVNQTASAAEELELFTIIHQSGNEDKVKSLILTMFEAQPAASTDEQQWQPLLQKILSGEATRPPAAVYQLPVKRTNKRWRWMPAAAAVLILLAGVFYYYSSQHANELVLSPASSPATIADIEAPASANAVLTLADGRTIILDSAGNGSLAMQGDVSVVKQGDGVLAYSDGNISASVPMEFNTLTVPRGSKVISLSLSDGTKVWLNSESSIRYPVSFTGSERKVEIAGEAYFEVAHNADKPFNVQVQDMTVQVLGTHFNINSYADEGNVKTTLLQGSVKILNDGKQQLLRPGQQAIVKNSATTVLNTVNLEEVMAWKNGIFSFQNMELKSIMRQMARWYNVDVIYEDEINDNYTVNVSRNVPASQLFRFIEMSGGVHFTINDRKVIVKK
jgi:ferric-dicitrate binding protein FerR (iron transport regulator)